MDKWKEKQRFILEMNYQKEHLADQRKDKDSHRKMEEKAARARQVTSSLHMMTGMGAVHNGQFCADVMRNGVSTSLGHSLSFFDVWLTVCSHVHSLDNLALVASAKHPP